MTNWVHTAIATAADKKKLRDGFFEAPPFPVYVESQQSIVLLFCRREPLGSADNKVMPPHMTYTVDYPKMAAITDKAVTPADFGRKDPETEFLGSLNDLARLTGPEMLAHRTRYRELVSIVLEKEWLLGKNAADAGVKPFATELRKILAAVTPKVLEPYYAAAGRQFFAWLDKVAPVEKK